MQNWFRRISRLPWPIVIAFDVAAFIAAAFSLALVWNVSGTQAAPTISSEIEGKRVAISFDDTPRGAGAFLKAEARPQLLLWQLKSAGVKQAAFFVNPGRIDNSGDFAKLLGDYAKDGHVLANHTADHLRLSSHAAPAFLADVAEAETWLKAQKGYRPWFRYPELDEGGKDAAKREAVRAGLKTQGLRDGYVTADGWDWYLDSLTADAAKAGRKMDMDALRALYIETHVEAADFADKLARRTFGTPPAQILLLHDTDLAALYLGDLIAALRADGWTIITSDQAYAKPLPQAVKLPDINGTRLQMLARERGVPGPYWFERNEVDVMKKLFSERVLHE